MRRPTLACNWTVTNASVSTRVLGGLTMISSRTCRLGALVGFMTLASMASIRAQAQFPGREPTPNDTLKSTEVSADHKVTFRIYAPKASEVTLSGDFGSVDKMTKDDEGVWSLTVGPLTPD